MFQSGHRRYGQRMGDTDYPIEDYTEEDNWRYVEKSLAMKPTKPVIDGEPSYENIPQGLHDPKECYGKPVMSAAMLTGRFCRRIRTPMEIIPSCK